MEILFIVTICLFLVFSPLILGSIFLGWQKGIRIVHKKSGIEKKKIVLLDILGHIFSLDFLSPFSEGKSQ